MDEKMYPGIVLVDTCGNTLHHMQEPPPGSVLLVDGESGTAWQRHGRGGKWHSTTGAVRGWSSFFLGKCRNVILVYVAPAGERESK